MQQSQIFRGLYNSPADRCGIGGSTHKSYAHPTSNVGPLCLIDCYRMPS